MQCGYGGGSTVRSNDAACILYKCMKLQGRKVNWLILHGSHSASLTIPESSSPTSLISRHTTSFSPRYLALPLQYGGRKVRQSRGILSAIVWHAVRARMRPSSPRLLRTPFSPFLSSSFSASPLPLPFLARIFYLHCRSLREDRPRLFPPLLVLISLLPEIRANVI